MILKLSARKKPSFQQVKLLKLWKTKIETLDFIEESGFFHMGVEKVC